MSTVLRKSKKKVFKLNMAFNAVNMFAFLLDLHSHSTFPTVKDISQWYWNYSPNNRLYAFYFVVCNNVKLTPCRQHHNKPLSYLWIRYFSHQNSERLLPMSPIPLTNAPAMSYNSGRPTSTWCFFSRNMDFKVSTPPVFMNLVGIQWNLNPYFWINLVDTFKELLNMDRSLRR